MSKTVDEIHDGLLSEVSDSYQKTQGFPTWDILRAFAHGLKIAWDKIFDVEKKLDVDNLSGDELERFIAQRKGLSRKQASCAIGDITIVNGEGHIKVGDMFSTNGDVIFLSLEEKDVSYGDIVRVQAKEAGASGNVPIGAITKMPITIAGIVEITNDLATENGYDAETDDSLRERYYEALRIPATSGNIYHYRMWAKEVAGVGDAKVFPLWNGDNTVKVLIIDTDGLPANSTLVKNVQDYINPNGDGTGNGQAPIGAYCTIAPAKTLTINVSATIVYKDTTNIDNINQGIKKYIKAYLASVGFDKQYVSIGKIGDAIIHVDGVEDYTSLLINGGTNKIDVGDEYIPVLGEVTLNVYS